jgi:hypothetical protein
MLRQSAWFLSAELPLIVKLSILDHYNNYIADFQETFRLKLSKLRQSVSENRIANKKQPTGSTQLPVGCSGKPLIT